MMGITFLFGYTTLCSTFLLFLYFTLTNRFAIYIEYRPYDSYAASTQLQDQLLKHRSRSTECPIVNKTERQLVKRMFTINHEYPPRTETLEFMDIPQLSRGYNKARVRNNLLQCVKSCQQHAGSIVFITNVIALYDGSHRPMLEYQDRKPIDEEINARWLEIINTLQQNLKHGEIKSVVVLVEDSNVLTRLRKIDLEQSEKLIIHNANGMLKMTDSFEFATRCYKNQVVAIGNQDVVFGKGWDSLDVEFLEETKTMYALTRHNSVLNKHCYGNPRTGVCNIDYSWAHDAFIFHVKNYITHKDFPILHSKVYNVYGGENIVIWTFRKIFKYHVTNPCPILHLHHEHCVPIRNKRPREGNKTIWATADFKNSLY